MSIEMREMRCREEVAAADRDLYGGEQVSNVVFQLFRNIVSWGLMLALRTPTA